MRIYESNAVNMSKSRRFITAMWAILALLILGIHNNMDVSTAVAGVAMGLAAANAHEGRGKAK